MSISQSDFTKIQSILNSMTTAADAIGKAKRDVNLFLKIHHDYPQNIIVALEQYAPIMSDLLNYFERYETSVVNAALEQITAT